MKYIFKIIAFVAIGLLASCVGGNNKQLKEFEEKRKAEKIAHEARLKQYADSTVYLSFKGIELGQPFMKNI